MPAVPKKRGSKARRDRRRSHDALERITIVKDKKSGEYRLPHRIDLESGTYKGRKIIKD